MNSWFKGLLLGVLICWACPKTNGQISFKIDSLAFSFYDKSTAQSWEKNELHRRGPDVIVFGRLVNEGESPILLELYEDTGGDSLVVYKDLSLYVSYQDGKNKYFFPHDPLTVIDIMSYPYLAGKVLPTTSVDIDGKHMLLSVIWAGESIPLAFETLAKPKTEKKTNRWSQKKVIESIRSTLEIKPFVQDHLEVLNEDRLFSKFLLEQQKIDSLQSEYDVEASIPTYFLDTKPQFLEGDTLGFYQWFRRQLDVSRPYFLGKECRFIVVFVVGKEGKIVFVNATKSSMDRYDLEIEEVIKEVLLNSPQWSPGILRGRSVDSRISLSLSFDSQGNIVDLLLL